MALSLKAFLCLLKGGCVAGTCPGCLAERSRMQSLLLHHSHKINEATWSTALRPITHPTLCHLFHGEVAAPLPFSWPAVSTQCPNPLSYQSFWSLHSASENTSYFRLDGCFWTHRFDGAQKNPQYIYTHTQILGHVV